MMKEQLMMVQEWIDKLLPTLYLQHINDKINVTTLHHLIPHQLDKTILTAASTAYADKMKICTVTTNHPNINHKQYAHPPQIQKNSCVDTTFDKTTSTMTAATTASTQSTSTAPTATAQPTARVTSTTTTPAFDSKAKLDWISNEIKQNLTKHFESIFAQMENKINNWTKKQGKQHAKQDKINAQVAKQLSFLADNMKSS